MTPEQLDKELQARGLNTQAKAAAALGVAQATISKWTRGQRPIPYMLELALASIPKSSQTLTKTPARRTK